MLGGTWAALDFSPPAAHDGSWVGPARGGCAGRRPSQRERAAMIRRYRPSDLERLKAITVVGFEGVSIDHGMEKVFGRLGRTDWKWRKARSIEWDVQADADGVFVYEAGGEVVGYITTRRDQESKIGWIPNIAVAPAYRRKGVGKALMTAALEHLRQSGMRYAKIETLVQNKIGQTFYPRVGFKEVARQIHYLMKL
jgi:ribosomal protein S18 acetylase RimI-like enzyme